MAISATPAYLGQDFTTASPGLRFGMYLPLWDLPDGDARGRLISPDSKGRALLNACKLNDGDRALMKALTQRAQALAQLAGGALLQIQAEAIAPFTTGLGNAHPLENGFAFLNPYGLPYLAGSGIKGVLRAAAMELAQGEWGGGQGWDAAAVLALFGSEAEAQELRRGALSFWDVLPQVPGDKLHVEVMTPHQSHYLQGKESPHDSGSPNPITFLTVPPGAKFAFTVQCDERLLGPPDSALVASWRGLLKAAFDHAFEWLGFGAKTAVGYGAMKDVAAASRPGAGSASATKLASDTETWLAATLIFDKGRGELRAKLGGVVSAPLKGDAMKTFMTSLGEDDARLRKKGELKNVALLMCKTGNQFDIKALADAATP
ncbi:type III-B CRISPR module RAMP protein Cmr6 [Roseateles sp.]|uniref:type III-B CRISPR module RAMP protein Cmr6 n=1 Tax=Roseateles sp. TaxID=1971397 RepID=UPI00286A5E1E|nr:type III-B CRISPR module RAMP protein Cmr6 [Roseateles sp.]